MSFTNTTKFANRLGLNIKFYPYNAAGTIANDATPLLTVDFANEVSLEASGENVWATGGQKHSNKIVFRNIPEGTFTISTQIDNVTLKKLASGEDISSVAATDHKVSFGEGGTPSYYIITGDTLWQDESGVSYTESIKLFKASVKAGVNATWTGDGDPQSRDIEFELALNDDGKMLEIDYDEQAAD